MSKTRYIAWIGHGADEEFDTLADADAYMREEGLEPTGETASDGEIIGGRIAWDGECEFWTAPGRSLDSYGDGYEPRIRVLHKVGEASDADED